MVKLDEKDLYQLLIAEMRYAIKRDNHLAPSSSIQHIKEYLPEMSKQWRAHTAKQLIEEIISERSFMEPRLKQDEEWDELLVFLLNYLEELPYNLELYNKLRLTRPEAVFKVDFYSEEVQAKIAANRLKN
jgi:hypothetical protein